MELLFLSECNEAFNLMLNEVKVFLIEMDLILLCGEEAKPALFIFLFKPWLLFFFFNELNDGVLGPLHE